MKRIKQFFQRLYIILRFGRKFYDALPVVFDVVDDHVPDALGKVSGADVAKLIAHGINNATSQHATKAQIETVIDLYDPTIAAIKAFRRRK